MKLRQEIKDAIQLIIVITILGILLGVGMLGMKIRTEQINNQTKMTEMLATDQS